MIPWLGLASLACDRGKKAEQVAKAAGDGTEKDGDEAVAAAGNCDEAHGKAIEQEMLRWCELSDKVASDDVPLAPWKPAPADRPANGRIEVRPGALLVGWGRTAELGELADQLAQDRDMAKERGETTSGWALTIEGDTPRAEVAAVLKALHDAGQREGSLVLTVAPTDPMPQPRDPERLAALNAKIGTADPSQRAALLAREIEQAMPPCPAMTKPFEAVATAAPAERCPLLARGFSEGLVACKCAKEDEMLTLVYAIAVSSTPPERLTTVAPVILDSSATPPPGATWAEVVAGLDEAPKTLWID